MNIVKSPLLNLLIIHVCIHCKYNADLTTLTAFRLLLWFRTCTEILCLCNLRFAKLNHDALTLKCCVKSPEGVGLISDKTHEDDVTRGNYAWRSRSAELAEKLSSRVISVVDLETWNVSNQYLIGRHVIPDNSFTYLSIFPLFSLGEGGFVFHLGNCYMYVTTR